MNRFTTPWIQRLRLPLTALALAASTALFAPAADACRDCPFPMRIADGRWLLPNGELELSIEVTEVSASFQQISVKLLDPRTQDVVAMGSVKHRKKYRTVHIALIDREGRLINGVIQYVGPTRERIRVKFTCESCSIGHLLH